MSSLSSTSIGSFGQLSVGGLISGLDTSKIIQGLLAIDQQKLDDIARKTSDINTQQTAFKGVEAKVLALQLNVGQLARAQNGLFDRRTATSSDPTLVTAAASKSAVAGVYQLHVNRLAQTHQIASQGFDAPTDSVTHGPVQIKIADTTTSITIDSSNDTLQGLADAINNSGAAVSASVVSDGSGTVQQGYRLVLSSEKTGIANRIEITNNLASSAGNATRPRFDAGSIGSARAAGNNTGTSAVQANTGATYAGQANNDYQFTIVTGGTVGVDDGLQLSYIDATGAHTGTITVNHGDMDNLLSVAEGIQVKFGAGTLSAGDTFHVKTFVPTIQEATDASVTLGAGSGALTVTSATNQVDSLIPGVALNLLNSDPAKAIRLTVADNTDSMKAGIVDFVKSFNDLMADIDAKTSYSPDTQQAGILLGNRQVLTIQDQVRSAITDVVAGANPKMSHLGALGITSDDSGHLVVDDAKLSSVLNGGVAGVSLDDVRKFFALTGSSTNSGISFASGSSKTVASTNLYTVRITQAADRATLTAPTAAAASTVIDNTNNALTISVDGVNSSALTLPAGTYTRFALVQALQAAINGNATLAGRHVSVGLLGDALSITSERFGSGSKVAMQSGSALTALGFAGGEAAQGHDVAGDFLVNGVSETAHGTGQFLIGDSPNANTADLQLRVALTPAQVGAGTQADITVSRGIASRLDKVLASLLDPGNGRLKTVDDSFVQTLADLDKQKTRQTDFMNARQQSLQEQFTIMERTLSQLQAASNFIAAQSANILANSQKK